MRPVLLAVLGISALAIAPLWVAAGCAAGSENPASSHAQSGAGTRGTGGSTGGQGGTGGDSTGGKSTGGSNTGGENTGGGGGTGGTGGDPCVPSRELCDGQDNDCNGVIDDDCNCKDGDTTECFTGDLSTLGVGVCHGGTMTCDLTGTYGPCVGEVTESAEVCNGLDDDCDGTEDDGLGQTTCGQGACTVTVDNCIAGVPQVCVPLASDIEKCNGLDDNCDGQVDEGCSCIDGQMQACYTGGASTLGVGACHGGTQLCAGGVWGPCNGQQLPVPEICNAIDDNCDGAADEGLGTQVCGVGGCQVTTPNCVGGNPQVCTPGQPVAETCNNVDDDCNGQIDDGLGTIGCGVGACAKTVDACTNGMMGVCVPGLSSPEICDSIDNDCDGMIDNGDPGGGGGCMTGNLGICAAGTQHCQGGGLTCVQNAQPGFETCDGLDNDCNGMTDENNPGGGMQCMTGNMGVCAAGTTNCMNGSIVCTQNTPSSPEQCDGLDNNCNGVPDDGNPGGGLACNTGLSGVCSAGITSCLNGGIACNQSVQPSSEICDGKDNDCDGSIDEGGPGSGQPCNTGLSGVCAAGTTACSNGAIVCNQNVQPSNEICDGKDNDCDGQVDEGNPGGNVACNTGLLGVCSAGTTACSNGSIVCNQNVQSSVETCDGKDNDCDGQTDEGNPGGNVACNTGLLGVCVAGTTACSGGAIVCNQNVQPSAETCDGKDNNCDGQVDNGNPGGGVACSTGLSGVCSAGTTACTGGAIVCNQNVQPSSETCDGFDNNCNGVVDEGNPGGNAACNTGQAGVCSAGTTACSGGALICNQNVQPSAEVCDQFGLDENCNGASNEGCSCFNGQTTSCYSGAAGTQGIGVCHAGTATCVNGQYGACAGEVIPSAESCDGQDNNCNGVTDEGVKNTYYADTDGDGYGNPASSTLACTQPAGYVANANDCDDTKNAVHPGVAETCNLIDDNCNGQIDEGVKNTYYADADADGYGNPSVTTQACTLPAGYSTNPNDCNDAINAVHPGAVEVCNGVDDNCNNVTDEGDPGSGAACVTGMPGVCSPGTNHCVLGAISCVQNVAPNNEICDGLDNDCDGQTDEGVTTTYYRDLDGDGYGNPGVTQQACSQPAGYVSNSSDCDDSKNAVHPGVAEVCDGIDNDCAGGVDNGNPGGGVACSTGLAGICAAGTTACQGGVLKCNQNQNPSTEVCDGLDNDCNGQTDLNAYYTDNVPNSCGTAGNKTITINPGGTGNVTGVVDPNGDDYFIVTFTGAGGPGDYYHPKIELTTNPGNQYTMYLENACGSGAWCGGPNTKLELSFPSNPNSCKSYGNCSDVGQSRYTTWVVRVTRANGPPTTCAQYTVTASNQ